MRSVIKCPGGPAPRRGLAGYKVPKRAIIVSEIPKNPSGKILLKEVAERKMDAGIEVIYAGRFNLPGMIVRTAIQENVDIIGLSCGSWEYLYDVPELIDLLKAQDLAVPVIIGGPIITAGDEAAMKQKGVAAVFGPSSTMEQIVETFKNLTAA